MKTRPGEYLQNVLPYLRNTPGVNVVSMYENGSALADLSMSRLCKTELECKHLLQTA